MLKVDDDGLHIEDEKTGMVDTLSMDDLKMFLGRSITFNMNDAVKEDMES